MAAGILIDIEGGDGSGKTEQARRLFERVQKEGHDAAYFDFPRYERATTGKLIGELLAGKHGDFMSVSAYLSALPYTLDRVGVKDELIEELTHGKIIVSNRYTPSNLAHQSAKLPPDEQPQLVELIETIEYQELGLPRPDVVFYLSVPTDISSELMMKKEKRNYLGDEKRDLAERNVAHQDRTRAAYLRLAKEKGWHIIECVAEGKMRSREDIGENIWQIVAPSLKK